MANGLRREAFNQSSYDFWTGKYGVVNVKDFGAVGDGVHDDTAAIQAAVNERGLHGVLIFPTGIYSVTSMPTISAAVDLIDSGASISIDGITQYRGSYYLPANESIDVMRDFGASGSSRSTTGTAAGGSTALSLASAIDFENGQGIMIYHAGAACAAGAPTALAVTPTGTTGTAAYTYAVAALDYHGGVSSPAVLTISSGNATLGSTNYNAVSWSPPVSGETGGFAVWRQSPIDTAPKLIWIGWTTSFDDVGLPQITGSYNGSPSPIIPFDVPPSSLNQTLKTTIVAGSGTTTLVLAASSTASVSATPVTHWDFYSLQNAINAAVASGVPVHIPDGVYLIDIYDTIGISSGVEISGSKYASIIRSNSARTVNASGYGSMLATNATCTNMNLHDFTVDGNANYVATGSWPQNQNIAASVSNSTFTRLNLVNSIADGLSFGGGNGQGVGPSQDVLIDDCSFDANMDNALSGIGPDFVVTNNRVHNNSFGETFLGSNADKTIISNNRIGGDVYAGIHIYGPSVSLVVGDNIIEGLNSSNQIGIEIDDGSTLGTTNGVIVENNVVNMNGNAGYGIVCSGHHNSVRGNNISNGSGTGILAQGSYMSIEGNTFTEIGGFNDSTVTIGSIFRGNVLYGCSQSTIQGDTSVSGNVFYNGTGIAVRFNASVPFATFHENVVRNSAASVGVEILNAGCSVIGNEVSNSFYGGAGGSGSGIYIYNTVSASTSAYATVTGNRCYDDQTTKTQYSGIQFNGPSSSWSGVVSNNDCRGNAAHTIVDDTLSAALSFADNPGTNPIGNVAPPASPLVSGAVYQNTSHAAIVIYQPVTYNPTSSTAATCAMAVGPTSTPAVITTDSEPASLTVGRIRTSMLRVPPGYYYSFTVTNATLGTANIQGE